MNQQIAIAIVIICIFATFGTTYIVVNAYKDQEIIDLKAQYKLDIYNLNNDVSDLNEEVKNLNDEIEENRFLGQWFLLGVEYITFYKNKTTSTSLHSQISTYEITNGNLVLTSISETQTIYNYYFSENDTVLYLENITMGKQLNYTKQFWCEL